jgi:hypothetical protein
MKNLLRHRAINPGRLTILEPSNTSEDSTIRMSDRDGTSPSEGISDKDEGGHSFSFQRKQKRSKKWAPLEDVEMGIVKPLIHSSFLSACLTKGYDEQSCQATVCFH